MNNAPAVYVPTEPEGNGLTLPMLLSLLAHGIVLGVLIYTYQQPEIEPAGSIETTMVSPGELAQMQGQILANRAAAQAQSSSASSNSATMPMNESNNSFANPSSSQSNSQQSSVFTQSNEPATRPLLMSEEQQQRLLEQSRDYDRSIAEWTTDLDDSSLENLTQADQEQIDEQKKSADSRAKSTDQVKINKPTRDDRNINIELGSSGKSFDLSDGQSTASAGSSSGTSNKSSGGSRGASNGEIVNLIKRNYSPPTGAKGSTQRTTLSITVNANGDVVSVSASGANEAVNEAAKQAVRGARNLPIDTDDPKYPTFTIQFNGSN